MEANNRVFGLDLIRSLAIIFVVLGHSQRILRFAHPEIVVFTKIDGVTLFFVLSGFLIGRIIYRAVQGDDLRSLYRFYNRRWWRTLPNYYLFFGFHIIFYYALDVQHMIDWRGLFFIQNLTSPPGAFFRESWSLAVEEWFYLTFPLIYWVILRFTGAANLKHYLIYTLVFLMISWLYKYGFFANHPEIEKPQVYARLPVVFRISSILWGVLLGIVYLMRPKWLSKGWPWLLAGIALWIVGDAFMDSLGFFWKSVWKYELKSVLALCFIAAALHLPRPKPWLASLVTQISVYSYSMYLINLPFLSNWRRLLLQFDRSDPAFIWTAIIIAWLLIFFLSRLNYHVFERRMTALRMTDKRS